MLPALRPYQSGVVNAVLDSVTHHRGLTFSVEIARQGGKNEISARLESILLCMRMHCAENLVKCSPTFEPQAVISMNRLQDCLNDSVYTDDWNPERSYIIRLGNARAIFLSADESSRVVGHTAHLLLEIDEAQDVEKEKYSKEFRPMGSTTNVTTVLYGTAWDDSTLLEEVKQLNLELERKDGIRRHFQYDWQEVAKYNPVYQAYVENERRRLGANHPLFLTQYCLQPIRGGDGFFSTAQRAQLQGTHPRLHHPPLPPPVSYGSRSFGGKVYVADKVYVAGIDLAGEIEQPEGEQLVALSPRRDSTVVTIAEVDFSHPRPDRGSRSVDYEMALDSHFHGNGYLPHSHAGGNPEPRLDPSPDSSLSPKVKGQPQIRIVEHYQWTGRRHTELYPQLVDLLKNVWRCRRVVVDATGIGQPVASFLREALGRRTVIPFTFTASSKSALGFNLLAAVDSGSVKMYAGDDSAGAPAEYREFWHQVERAKSYYRASQTMNFYVDPAQGHDDFLMSLALCVEAAGHSEPRISRGYNPGGPDYLDLRRKA